MKSWLLSNYGSVAAATLMATVAVTACEPSDIRSLATQMDWTAAADISSLGSGNTQAEDPWAALERSRLERRSARRS